MAGKTVMGVLHSISENLAPFSPSVLPLPVAKVNSCLLGLNEREVKQ